MDRDRFENLAAAYGGDPRRWPAAERDAARAFLDADPEAERLLFEARQLDAALDASPQPRVSRALRDAILAAAPQPGPEAKTGGFFHDLLFGGFGRGLMVAGLTAAAVLGVAIGAGVTQNVLSGVQAEAIVAEAGEPVLDELEILG